MKTFTIENETNHITTHVTAQDAESVAGAERFATAEALAELAADWPSARLVEIWNSLPGVTSVKKFKDRATAVSRIWKAIQSLGEAVPVEATPAKPVAPQTPDVAPEELPAKTKAARAKKSPVAATKKNGFREGSKTEIILGLMKRPNGASLKEIMEATDWQAHSVRGFISGTLGKKMSLSVVSTKTGDGERIYCLKA